MKRRGDDKRLDDQFQAQRRQGTLVLALSSGCEQDNGTGLDNDDDDEGG